MSVQVEIDVLVFEGMDMGEAQRAAAAFERQLAELLDLHGLPDGKGAADLSDIDLGTLPLSMTTPEARGAELARGLFAELAK